MVFIRAQSSLSLLLLPPLVTPLLFVELVEFGSMAVPLLLPSAPGATVPLLLVPEPVAPLVPPLVPELIEPLPEVPPLPPAPPDACAIADVARPIESTYAVMIFQEHGNPPFIFSRDRGSTNMHVACSNLIRQAGTFALFSSLITGRARPRLRTL